MPGKPSHSLFGQPRLALTGGVGDCLNTLTLWRRCPALHARTGLRTLVGYGGPNDCGWSDAICDLCDRSDCLEYCDDTSRWDAARDLPDASWSGLAVMSLGLRLGPSEGIGIDPARFTVAVQPRGNAPQKRWSSNRVRALLAALETGTDCVVLVGPSDLDEFSTVLDGVGGCSVLSVGLASAIDLVGRCDHLVAVDSWSKYVRRWRSRSMDLVVADVPPVTPWSELRRCFGDIPEQGNARLWGLGGDGSLAAHCDDADPLAIAESVNKRRREWLLTGCSRPR